MFNRACPILPSANFEKTKAFYTRLGFKVAAEYKEEGYLIVIRDVVEVHFFHAAQHVAQSSDHGVFIRVDDANALSTEYETLDLQTDGIPRFVKAEDKPWGMCELAVVDPDGNLLRIGHILEGT